MDQGLLVTEETDAGADFVRRFDKHANVTAAFWVKESEETRWYLYIASDHFDDTNLDNAYGEVLRLAEHMANPYFDPFQVKLVTSDDPLAQAALEINRRYPGKMATRLGGRNFGGMSVEGVYIYSTSLVTVTP